MLIPLQDAMSLDDSPGLGAQKYGCEQPIPTTASATAPSAQTAAASTILTRCRAGVVPRSTTVSTVGMFTPDTVSEKGFPGTTVLGVTSVRRTPVSPLTKPEKSWHESPEPPSRLRSLHPASNRSAAR